MSGTDLEPPLFPAGPSRGSASGTVGLAGSLLMVGIAAIAALSMRSVAPADSVDLVFLVAVLFSAAFFGWWAGLLASVASLLAFDFLFVEPELTFRVARTQDVIALTVFVLVAGLTGTLAGRLREQALAAGQRARLLEHLSDLSKALVASNSEAGARAALLDGLRAISGTDALIVDKSLSPSSSLGPDDMQAAERALRLGAPQIGVAAGWTGGRYSFYPLLKDGEDPLAAGVRPAGASPEQERAVRSAIEQTGAAIARLRLASEVAAAQLKAETEALRAAVLSSLSHDLKTPLATILGSVTTLRQLSEALPPNAREDLLQVIEEDARRLNVYVGDLLHMTRLQSGLDPRLDWVDPRDVLNAAVGRVQRQHPGRRVEVAADADLPLLRTDAALVEQAIFNCLDNAAGIAPAQEPIRASVRLDGEDAVFVVEDDGPGVPPEDFTRIFEPFQRGQSPKAGGVGLGLAIAKGIVQALGGSIGVESPLQDGRGARFRLAFPVERQAGR